MPGLDPCSLEARLQILCHNPLQAASPFDYVEHVYEAGELSALMLLTHADTLRVDRASKNLRAVRVRLEQHTNGLWYADAGSLPCPPPSLTVLTGTWCTRDGPAIVAMTSPASEGSVASRCKRMGTPCAVRSA